MRDKDFLKLLKNTRLTPAGCLEWTGCVGSDGYGQIYSAAVPGVKRVHRFVWTVLNGDIPEGMYICHSCDNPICCNLEHLFLGTPKDNMLDKYSKKRANRHSRLTQTQASEIIDTYRAGGVTQQELAHKFKLSQTTISCIINKRINNFIRG